MEDKFNFKQVIPKTTMRVNENCVSIRKSNISIGSGFSEILTKQYLEIFEDTDKRILMIQESDDKIRGWKIRKRKLTFETTYPSAWIVRRDLFGLYEGEIVDKKIIINLKNKIQTY